MWFSTVELGNKGDATNEQIIGQDLVGGLCRVVAIPEEYSDAFAHVPGDLALHSIDVSSNPVPQHAFLASAKPV